MAQKRSEQKKLENSYLLGESNANLIPRINRWCDHLRVRQASRGLLADISGLPIGMMAVECPHASKGGIQAMDLRKVAAFFVTTNCKDCPHHKELHPDNVGRDILNKAEQIREERLAAKATESTSKKRLRSLVSKDLTQALKSAPTTEQSVLELVALLDDDTHAQQASDILLRAAEVAPEFFSSLACEVISEHFTHYQHGGTCAAVIRAVGQKRNEIPPASLSAALQCVQQGFCHDEVIGLLADHFKGGGELPNTSQISRIIDHHGYSGSDPLSRRPVPELNQIRSLAEIGKRDLNLLVQTFVSKLEHAHKNARVGIAVTIRALILQLPQLGLFLVDPLVKSLSLDDDNYGPSADWETCKTLADIFCLEPSATQTKLETAFISADEEIKKLLYGIYRAVIMTSSQESEMNENVKRAISCLPQVRDILLSSVIAHNKPLEVREVAAEAIDRLGTYHHQVLLTSIDTVFGALAILSHEEAAFIQATPGDNPLLPGYPRSERLQFERICHHLIEALEVLSKKKPDSIQRNLSNLLASLSSKVKAQELLKIRLIRLFKPLSRDHHTAPAIIPDLFKPLMDMDSVPVRVAALGVVENLLRLKPEIIPDNMREMLVVYLTDSYVAIHQGAARAIRYMRPETTEEAKKIAHALLAQFSVYVAQQNADTTYLGILADAMGHVCDDDAGLFVDYALPVLIKQGRCDDSHDASEALQDFQRALRLIPKFGYLYVRELLSFFVRFSHESHDAAPYSTEHQLFLSLFQRPTPDIRTNTSAFHETIRKLAKVAPYFGLQLVSVLLHHELFEAAAEGAQEILKALPVGAKSENLRQQAQLTAAAAHVEAKVRSMDITGALQELSKVAPILSNYVQDKNQHDTDAIVDALTVADCVAKHLK